MNLSAEDKDGIRKDGDREDFCLDQHFGLALWIRKTMIHQNRNRIDLFADFQRGCREGRWSGTFSPDDVSGVIVGLVWDALHGR